MLHWLMRLIGGQDSRASKPNGDREPIEKVEAPKSRTSDFRAWWIAEFTTSEREYINKKYQPQVMGIGGDRHRDVDEIIKSDGTPRLRLTRLATWFMSPKDDLPLAIKLLRKGVELGEDKRGSALDQHFTLLDMIKVYYRNRSHPDSLVLAIDACKRQIALAPVASEQFRRVEQAETLPSHTGFHQLAIIMERDRDYEGAIRLSREALRQGWAGDWEKRITRCEARQSRSN